ncbi:hypothetical protein PENSPDRAFT_687155 [Peniophora sp. CONT]|nr:hypothetical protein PENSPDRAFT_687155 [Peniophora sp. CONT]
MPSLVNGQKATFIRTINAIALDPPAFYIPILSRLLTSDSPAYCHDWCSHVLAYKSVALWFQIDPIAAADRGAVGRFVAKIHVQCPQERAGAHLAYAASKIIRDISYEHGVEHRPRVVEFAHSISTLGAYAVIVFDEQASHAYDSAATAEYSKITSAPRHIVVFTPSPLLAMEADNVPIDQLWRVTQ